jgi:hypothetical protein
MIRAGLLLQLVFLFLVDWGSISGMTGEQALPWGHVFGLLVVNAMLLVSAYYAWNWMRRAQAEQKVE